ncbi:hypothetical protein CCHR01_04487 [Colletotrichum chrysophilum]|uniref:2EXR domain-containing protein n=1 Tax=Colletotrichum chrysophilum TaxID=1836956 RepID=A0AAD9ATD0_9PEZI|nr:hypothetical protein CCHR01_04487 [Colletotrichum chrysophilum]
MKQGESLPLHHRILLQRHRRLRNIITMYHEPPNSEEPYVSSLTNLTDVVTKIHRRSNQQNNFHRFQHLPVELQIEVWKWTLVEPQVYYFSRAHRQRDRILGPQPRPALLVCALSRQIAKETLCRMPQTMRTRDTRKDQGWIYVSPATDLFYNDLFNRQSPNCPESWKKMASGTAVMKKTYEHTVAWYPIRMTKLEKNWFVKEY